MTDDPVSVMQEDKAAAAKLLESIADLTNPTEIGALLGKTLARHRTQAIAAERERTSKALRDRAASLRTPAGRNKAQWHENDADMVANELDRQATAIRQEAL